MMLLYRLSWTLHALICLLALLHGIWINLVYLLWFLHLYNGEQQAAAATSIAIDNLLALGHHVFGPTFDSLSPLLKGVSDNEAITNKCQQASLFPAALVVSKLYSLWKELRNPVYDENGQLFAMKGLGWVTRWDSLMASIDFSIHDITAFETSALPRYPSIFRVGHLAQVSTGKRILDGQESQTSNSICLGHLAVIYNFPDWPTCTRPHRYEIIYCQYIGFFYIVQYIY